MAQPLKQECKNWQDQPGASLDGTLIYTSEKKKGFPLMINLKNKLCVDESETTFD